MCVVNKQIHIRDIIKIIVDIDIVTNDIVIMLCNYSEYSMFVVGDYVPKWLPKWASKLKTIMSDLRLRNGNFPFQNQKGCELGLYSNILMEGSLCNLLSLLTYNWMGTGPIFNCSIDWTLHTIILIHYGWS